MNPQTLAWIVVVMVGAFCGVLTDLIIQMVRGAINKTKPWLIALDEEGGIDYLGRAKMDRGHLVAGKEDQKRRYPVVKEARRVTTSGIAYIVGRQTGANFQVPEKTGGAPARAFEVPSKDDMLSSMSEGERVAFNLCDPLLLAKVFDKNQFQETVTGQNKTEDWRKSLVWPVAIVGGIAVLGLAIVAGMMAGG